MKLLILASVYMLMQSCCAAPISDYDDQVLRSAMEELVGLETNNINTVMDYLKKNQINPIELITTAMQSDVCKNGIDIKRMISVASDIPEKDVDTQIGDLTSTVPEITDNQLDSIRTQLNDLDLAPEMVGNFMELLGELQLASQNGLMKGEALEMVDTLMTAAIASSDVCQNQK